MTTGLHTALGIGALASYFLSAAAYMSNLGKARREAAFAASGLAVVGALLNFAALYTRARALGTVPYADLLGSMSLFGFFLAFLNVVLEARHRDRALGPFLMPAAFLVLTVSLIVPPGAREYRKELHGALFALHVTLNMLAYAAFAVAAALAGLYLAVGKALKAKSRQAFEGPLSRLPTLSYLERANRTSLSVGVLALLVGLSCGMAWATHVWKPTSPAWWADPKIAATFLILAFYLTVAVRAHLGAAPSQTARLTVTGFVLVMISFTAINLLFSRLHVFT